jgi:small ligand-binding sensory domain FIST
LPGLIVAGHGVLSERGEVEGETALSAVVWEGGTATTISLEDSQGPDVGLAVASALEAHATLGSTAFLFLRPRGVLPHMLDPLRALPFGALVGAGTRGDGGVVALGPHAKPAAANLGALVLRGIAPPAVRSSPACRLLTPLLPITATRGPMVLELGGERALEALSAATANLKDQPLLFVALAEKSADASEQPPLLLRGIQGIDPLRQGIVVSEEVREGVLMAFAVRDPVAARSDLETATARLARETAGAAARFGVYLSCAGRGSSLYGSHDVDTRVIRARFGDLPLAGMHSSFEIAPHAGSPTLQLYTGVLSVFTEPS